MRGVLNANSPDWVLEAVVRALICAAIFALCSSWTYTDLRRGYLSRLYLLTRLVLLLLAISGVSALWHSGGRRGPPPSWLHVHRDEFYALPWKVQCRYELNTFLFTLPVVGLAGFGVVACRFCRDAGKDRRGRH